MTPHAGGFWKKIFWVGRSENFNFGGGVVLRGSVSAVKGGGGPIFLENEKLHNHSI